MKNELRNQFDEAIRLKEASDFEGAHRILRQLHTRDPSSPTLLAILADVCWELGHLDEAISYFQQATVLRPNCEAVSLGLFHCLWDSDHTDDAFNEMKRFLAQNKSEEYNRLLADINKDVDS